MAVAVAGALALPAAATALPTFGAPVTTAITFSPDGGSHQFGVGDIDGDGRADVVLGSNRRYLSNGADDRGEVRVYRGLANGGLSAPEFIPVPAPTGTCSGPSHTLARAVALGDINGDGKLDIAYGTWERNCPGVILNTTTTPGSPTFAPAQNVIDNGVGSGPQWVALGDADGDGRLDLVAAISNGDVKARIWRNVDQGVGVTSTCSATTGPSNCWRDVATGNSPQALALANLNGDQYADLVVKDSDEGGRMAVGLGSATGPAAVTRVGPSSSGAGNLIAVGDLTGDGRADLVQPTTSGVRVMLNNGDGTFTGDGTLYTQVTGVFGVDTADMDADGRRDVVVTGFRSGAGSGVSILFNASGNGTLGTTLDLPSEGAARAVRAADITGDGVLDIVTMEGSTFRVYVGSLPPGTPAQPTATAGNAQATITVAPGSGATPTSYAVTASPGGATCTVTGASGSCTITGLSNGTSYTFTATATNGVGTSAASAASSAVTPQPPATSTPATSTPAASTPAASTGAAAPPEPPPGRVGVSVNGGAVYARRPAVQVSLVWPSGAARVLVSNDGGFADAREFPVQARIPWTLRSSGPEREPRVVYVRFLGAGISATETHSDDIILDQRRPVIISAAALARGGDPSRFILRVRARDRITGLSTITVTSRASQARTLRFRTAHGIISRAPRIRVRVRDRAGNWSDWRWVGTPRTFGPWQLEASARRAERILGGRAVLTDDQAWVILNPRRR